MTRFPMLAVVAALLLTTGCTETTPSPETSDVDATDVATTVADGEQDVSSKPADISPDTDDPEPQDMTTPTPDRPTIDPASIELRNRLSDETSPYLLQHQHNSVHWYPWGPEAFEAARALDRPIFLSVGYSTCYWCHVMERESFEDDEVAELMNKYFICIKVDREERPDVDDIYMAATYVINRRGGWPNSVFMEPDSLRPFMAGTYFPKTQFMGLMEQINGFWETRRDDVMAQAQQVSELVITQLSHTSQPQPVSANQVETAAVQMLANYDRQDAGFGGAPKFPMPVQLDFLMAASWDDSSTRQAVMHTLDRMATGGMYDQVGGGFHRYSVDAKWLVPHFEKMLYDNGQLASTYAMAFEKTRDPFYAEIVRETCDYVLREMTDASGGFHSAQDAEVNEREGQNYIWTADEVTAALSDAGLDHETDFALQAYGLSKGTNFQDPHHPEDGPRNVLFLAERPDRLAETMGMQPEEFNDRISVVNAGLLKTRDQRDQPGLDDKILAGWNGLMIMGMADAGRVLDEAKYIDAARRAATYVLDEMRTPEGGLLRTSRAGQARIDAFLEDYAFLVRGLLSLHQAIGDRSILSDAKALTEEARERFWDPSRGGYFDTMANQSDLFVRTKTFNDGAVPCGNSVMLENLIRLHEYTGDGTYLDDAFATLDAVSSELASRPTVSMVALAALHRLTEDHPQRFGAEFTIRPGENPVRVSASSARVQVQDGTPSTFDVVLQVARGHHVNANEPGIDYLIPLEIKMVGGEGLDMSVGYPAGEEYDGPEGRMLVHHGTVNIPVRLTRTGPLRGRASVVLTYQVCTDVACLAPETVQVPIRISE